MQFDIPRLAIDRLSIEDFLQDYYLPEKPVLLVGLAPPDEKVILGMRNQPDQVAGFGFLGTRLATGDSGYVTPDLVSALLERNDIVKRERPMRVWAQRKGHHTLVHYDGNSLHGLNWQVSGRKRWSLISPDTPPRLYPFSPYAMVRETFLPDPRRHDFCQLITEPGDLLFLPRYWSHAVTSLEDLNTNLNWVWTPRTANLLVKVGRRECAVLALRKLIPGLSRLLYEPSSISNYGSGGPELLRSYTRSIGFGKLMMCLVAELGNAALLPFYHREVIRQAQRLATSSASTFEQQ